MHGIGEGSCWLSTTFPTQKIRIILDRTDDSKNVLSLLHSERYDLTLAEPSRDIWWHVEMKLITVGMNLGTTGE